ncbi:MAG: AmmeMemoRadiSam system protein B [Candidatus Binatia bacterium]
MAGSFYPAAAAELSALLDDCLENSALGPKGKNEPNPAIVAGLLPHAGLLYSGPCAAHLFAQLQPSVRHVIVLGVNHRARGYRASLSPWRSWRTPFGDVTVDESRSDFLEGRVEFLRRDAAAHAEEHSIEIQLPFLQRTLGKFTLTPIVLADLSIDECAELGAAIAAAYRAETEANNRIIILASSDLSHYLSPKRTDELDRLALDQVLSLSPEGLLRVVEEQGITMCGVLPTVVMLFAACELGLRRAHLLKHCHSGDVTPMRKVVGYASLALEL